MGSLCSGGLDAELRRALFEKGANGERLLLVTARHQPDPCLAQPVSKHPQDSRHQFDAELGILLRAALKPLSFENEQARVLDRGGRVAIMIRLDDGRPPDDPSRFRQRSDQHAVVAGRSRPKETLGRFE